MSPEFGTKEYDDQVETIKAELKAAGNITDTVTDSILLGFIMNKSFSRAAICQADKEVKKERHEMGK